MSPWGRKEVGEKEHSLKSVISQSRKSEEAWVENWCVDISLLDVVAPSGSSWCFRWLSWSVSRVAMPSFL